MRFTNAVARKVRNESCLGGKFAPAVPEKALQQPVRWYSLKCNDLLPACFSILRTRQAFSAKVFVFSCMERMAVWQTVCIIPHERGCAI
jgi:hypothetical protein